MRRPHALPYLLWFALAAGCATRADGVAPQPTDASTFAALDCTALDDELDRVCCVPRAWPTR